MHRWFSVFLLGVMFVFPSFAFAQADVTLSNMSVQLWPEYDQPSMLVITDFEVAPDTQMPVDLTFHIPQDANLIAVAAYAPDGSLVNTVFDGPRDDGEWQSFTITMDVNTAHRFEYYQPITFSGNQRIFSYLWDGVYAVNAFDIRVLEPADTISLSTVPELSSALQEDGLTYYEGKRTELEGGAQFALNLEYEKTTDALISPPQGIQPSAPVDENTPGRVSLNNSLPYMIGGLGVIMIVGGFVYYWQAGRKSTRKARRRVQSQAENGADGIDAYCPQCGARAKSGDRFCRVCGARMRRQED